MEEGQPYELPMERAHAWPEIYVDGVGFVPVEVSPAYEGIMEEADMSIGISNSSLVREFDEEINDDTQGSYETGGDDDLTPDADIAFIVLCIFADFGRTVDGYIKKNLPRDKDIFQEAKGLSQGASQGGSQRDIRFYGKQRLHA